MIDEKKLVEEIQGMIVIQTSPDGRNREDELINSYNEAIFDLLKIIEEQPKVNEWIPVEERLPEKEGYYISGDYLVTLKYDILNMSVVQCARITPDERWMRMIPNGKIDVTNVIAWMPLPEAYGGE